MSKSKTPLDPNRNQKAQEAAKGKHRKGRPADDEDEEYRKPNAVKALGTAILVALLALSLVISVVTPFFM